MSDVFREHYGPWALVAGASEGMGLAFGEQLAGRGLNVVLLARREAVLAEEAERLRAKHGVEVRCAALDLASEDLVEQLAPSIEGLELGLLVYNAGLSYLERFQDVAVERALAQLYVNCRGPLLLAHALGKPMLERGRGGILLMSSAAGFAGSGLVATYAATKAFDNLLGEGLARDFEGTGVDVTTCVAGATRTPNFDRQMKGAGGGIPVMKPEDVVREALERMGSKPLVVAGTVNKLAVFATSRMLPRQVASRAMTSSTYKLKG